jgi:hypothetical protein
MRILLPVVAAFLLGTDALAQHLDSLTVGAHVRMREWLVSRQFHLVAIEPAHLSLRDESGVVSRVFVVGIRRLWVSSGRMPRTKSAILGFIKAGAAGALAGATLGALFGPVEAGFIEFTRTEMAGVWAVTIGGVAAGVGLIHGAIAPGPEWVRVIPPP